jgi:hypothetical protein
VTLDGSASTDPDAGTTLSYQWALTTGTGLSLTGPATAKPTFIASAVGTFVFTLTVGDGVATATDTVTIVVKEAGALTVANSGTSAVWRADFAAAGAGRSVQFQKRTIVTTVTTEVTTATWVSIGTATANSSGVATLTVTNPLEVSHLYRAVINVTSATPGVTNLVTYAARATKGTAWPRSTSTPTRRHGQLQGHRLGRPLHHHGQPPAGTSVTGCTAQTDLVMKISGRGNYTWTLDKKPYKIGSSTRRRTSAAWARPRSGG